MNIESLLSKRAKNSKPSLIREILKATANPETISFAGGLPSQKSFPIKELKEATEKVFNTQGAKAFQYSTTSGLTELKLWILEYYREKYQMTVTEDEILITSGSQQGLDLASQTLLNPNDNVLLEEPSYLGAIQCFTSHQASLLSTPIYRDGINPAALSKKLRNNDIKLMYVIPSFQNPTGITYSKERREELCQILSKHSTFLIEDDPYGELSFSGQTLCPMKKELGDQGILLGSFSKIVSPGLRLGWVIAHPTIISKMTILKQSSDLHTSTLNQHILYQFLTTYDLNKHLIKIRKIYQKKCSLMTEQLNKWSNCSFEEPTGGLFHWINIPKEIDLSHLLNECIKQNVLFIPGYAFCLNSNSTNSIRLNFSHASNDEIITGLSIIKNLIDKELTRQSLLLN